MKSNRFSVYVAGVLGMIAIVGSAFGGAEVPKGQSTTVDKAEAARELAKRPATFVDNVGQWDARGEFLLRTPSVDYWVTRDGFVLDYVGAASKGEKKFAGHAIGVKFVGGKPATVTGVKPLDVTRDYVAKDGTTKRATGFAEVRSEGIYPGVGLRSYVDQGSARYDIEVAPQADASAIAMKLQGADSVAVSKQGDLEIGTVLGTKKMVGLKAYQIVDGKEVVVPAKFRIDADRTVRFALGDYDSSRKLIIDPLIYGSYYGGDNGPDSVQAVSSDIDGGVYLTGKTRASQFPAIFGPYGFSLRGGFDAFITKLQGDAYSHDYAAHFGGARDDEGTRIGVDPFGNVWVAGSTFSLNFPGNTRNNIQLLRLTSAEAPTGGTFIIQALGFGATTPIPFDASPAVIQTALEVLFGAGNVTVTLRDGAGSLATGATYKVEINRNVYQGQLTIDSTGMAPLYNAIRGPNNLGQLIRVQGTAAPTGGTYRLIYNGVQSDPIAFNANLAQIRVALDSIPALTGRVQVVSAVTPADNSQLPAVVYFNLPDPIQTLGIDVTTLTGGTFEVVSVDTWFTFWDASTTRPNGGFFIKRVNGTGVALPWNVNAANMAAALNGALGDSATVVSGAPALPDGVLRTTFVGDAFVGGPVNVAIDSDGLQPKPEYSAIIPNDLFVIRFAKEGSLLNPLPTQSLIFGGDGEELMAGFSIRPKDTPVTGDPVEFLITGNNEYDIVNIPTTWNNNQSYFARIQYTSAGFTTLAATSGYFSDARSTTIGGGVLDAEGNMYLAGTVANNGNIDTAINPVFTTTAGSFEGSRLLRNSDMFVRKYNVNGTMLYSVLVGGNNGEEIGGFARDATGAFFNVGSAVAVDIQGNAYITGTTNSFNYPRTRGVYGEVFNNSRVAVVTKLNSDGSQIVYSTNLRTSNGARDAAQFGMAGIAVDQAGNAHVTGNLFPYSWFAENNEATPGDPNEPLENVIGAVPTTADALDPDLEMPDAGELPTQEGFYLVLNNTATNLLYGSYVGGLLDDLVFGPYVDTFGDSWINGYTDSFRGYAIFNSTGTPTIYQTSSSLPASLITPLAFKANGDAAGGFQVAGVLYGALNPQFPLVNPLAFNPPDGTAPIPQPTINTTNQRDGFVFRQRVAFPSVDSLSLAPNTVPGGLGASTTATVNLSAPAPAGGADVVVTLTNGQAASFANGTDQTTLEFTIPAGTQAVSFPVFTKPVTTNAGVDIRAAYLGSFKVSRLNVIPWLQQLGITPTEVVGGNTATGRVTLAAAAPAGGVTVDLLTDSADITNFGTGVTTVVIPAGQQTGTFPINTLGVTESRFPRITASLLGVGRTQSLTVRPTSLASVTFNPARIAGGSSTEGTVTLNGNAGPNFRVRLRFNAGTPGYRFRETSTSPQVSELVVTVPTGTRTATFQLDTVFESVNTQRVITAQMLNSTGTAVGSPVSGTIFVDAVNLTGLSIAPASVDGGEDLTGTVTIGSPAPAGGVVVYLESGRPSVAQVPATVTVAAGASSADFTITTNVVFGRDEDIAFKAKRGGIERVARAIVRANAVTLTLNPTSVHGGTTNSTGTIDIGAPAPAGGINVQVRSTNGTIAQVPATVNVPEGSQTATFDIVTRAVSTDTPVTISAILSTVRADSVLTVTTTRLLGFTLSSTQFRPFRTVIGAVELATPAPAGGVNVDLQLNANLFAIYPTTMKVFVPAGETVGTFILQAKALSVPTTTTVRASAGGVTRGIQINILR